MNTVFGIIIGLLVLMFLVVAHEFGHFIAARRNGVKVNEFGIGFPPRAIAWVRNPEYKKWLEKTGKKAGVKPKKWIRLPKTEWKKKHEGLIFSLNWLPIGGFCAMDGESDADTRKGTFGAASFWGKTKILFAGVAMNLLVAFVIRTVLAFTGMPHFIENQFTVHNDIYESDAPVFVGEVIENSPAAKAGLQKDDEITFAIDFSITTNNSVKINSTSDLTEFNAAHAGKDVSYEIKRGDETEIVDTTLNKTDDEYLLGITMYQTKPTLYRSTWSAPLVGAATTVQLTGETYKGLGQMLWNLGSGVVKQFSGDNAAREEGKAAIKSAGDSVSGPVGIIGVIFPAFTETGPTNLAFLAALISVSLACMNVLPIPALDGGRWLMMAIARLFGKKLSKTTEEKIVSRAFIFLIALIILITILDVIRLF